MLFSRDAIAPSYADYRSARAIMRRALAKEVRELANLGWSIKSQGATIAELETRQPFNWWLAYAGSLMLLGVGGLVYATSWLLSSRVRLFLRESEDAAVTIWGDTDFLSWQQLDGADADAGGPPPPADSTGMRADRILLGLSALVGVMLANVAIWFFLVLGVIAAFA